MGRSIFRPNLVADRESILLLLSTWLRNKSPITSPKKLIVPYQHHGSLLNDTKFWRHCNKYWRPHFIIIRDPNDVIGLKLPESLQAEETKKIMLKAQAFNSSRKFSDILRKGEGQTEFVGFIFRKAVNLAGL